MDALLRNGTWEIVELPKGRKVIGSKWIFKIKYQSSGEIDRFKARLVAQGFGQKEGIDYEETFSHVVKMVTVRCLLNVVVSNSWPVFQLDVNNAFLYGDLDEIVYMKPPEGYFPSVKARLVAQGYWTKEGIDYEETFSHVVKMVTVRCLLNVVVSNSWPVFQLDVNNAFLYGDLDEIVYMKPPEGYFPSGNKVCRLKKSLYGLKQAPKQWNAKLTSTLIENGFSQSKFDYSLYTKYDKGVFLDLLVYMDDIIITGNNVSEIEKFKVFLKSKFMIKDLEKLTYFLGIEVIDTEKGICLNQRKYVLDLLSEYGMLACKPVNTPLMSKLIISNEATEKDPILDNTTDYQRLMGKLIYLTNTRPDISYVVHFLSQFMHSPLKSHLKTSFKILRYLKGYPGLGIHIIKDSGMSLYAYSDADWAKCVVTRKSITCYCVFLNNSLVSSKSKK
ncbi:ribonuclease H-like domain-containing protein [Tanacetum coccineum]|uniref:Ribonuclease H-like domain-containing protein n=1 Tax=Tanacetum coccineum TaxID=301880 RepID=A0ABQ5HFA8_9ASTR